MIQGEVGPDRQPRVYLPVAGRDWPALIDTGFNGDLELPYGVGPSVEARYSGSVRSTLADGRQVVEDNYHVQIPFDGELVFAEARSDH